MKTEAGRAPAQDAVERLAVVVNTNGQLVVSRLATGRAVDGVIESVCTYSGGGLGTVGVIGSQPGTSTSTLSQRDGI